MKGRVSFSSTLDGDEEGEEGTTPIVKRPVVARPANVKCTRPTARGARGITASAQPAAPDVGLPLSQVRDRVDPTVDYDLAGPSEDAQSPMQEDGPASEEQQRRVAEARRVRAERAQEKLLERYISLEDTTQRHLDDTDMAAILRGGTRRQRPQHRRTWEDADDAEQQQQSAPLSSSESEGGEGKDSDEDAAAASGTELDMEAFEAYNRPSGRIEMMVRKHSGAEQPELVDIEDEEGREWELQQIRKGFAAGTPVTREARKASKALAHDFYNPKGVPRAPIPLAPLPTLLSQVSKDVAKTGESLEQTRNSLSQVELHRAECRRLADAKVPTLQEAASRRAFFEEMQAFFAAFAEMVEELMSKVEEMEQEWLSILRARRQARMMEGDENQHDEDQHAENHHDEDQHAENHHDGSLECDELNARIADLFDDVDPEYNSPVSIDERMRAWRERYPESYEQCYGDLCKPSLMEIFLRARLVGWDPFATGGSTHDRSEGEFLQELWSACGVALMNEEAAASMIETKLSPRLDSIIGARFDPLDARECQVIRGLIGELTRLWKRESRACKSLCRTVVNSILEVPIGSAQDAFNLLRSAFVLRGDLNDDMLMETLRAKIESVLHESWIDDLRLPNVTTFADLAGHLGRADA